MTVFKWDTIVLATRNQGKVKEMTKWFSPLGLEVKSVSHFSEAPEVEEDGDTFIDNAVKKAETISRFLHLPCLADDSGLEVEALNGKPGVYSARFAGPEADDEANNQKLIHLMKGIPFGERSACFRSALALAIPGESTLVTEGVCEGQILAEPKGRGGFGYDPLFYLPSFEKTMAELTVEEKNSISHRGKALESMKDKWLKIYRTT